MRALGLVSALLLIGSARAAAGTDPPWWTPIFDGQMLWGKVFQDGRASSWQGNADAQFTPAMRFSESASLLPTYAASYQGSRSATELAGGSQLFQDGQSHLLHVKALYRVGRWRFKPTLSYRWEYLRETSKERWGRGLFDYRKPAAGLEAEYSLTSGGRLDASFDYYAIDFPNYESLESRVGGSLGREHSQRRTLNTRNYSWTAEGSFPLPFEGAFAKLSGNLTRRLYPEQRLVALTGTLIPELRSDELDSLSAAFEYGRTFSPRLAGRFSCALTYTHDLSNQNHYDPQLNAFNPDYYSFEERSIAPKVSAVLGRRKVEAALSYRRIDRHYLGRSAQDAAGTHIAETTRLSQDSFLFDLAVPVARGFKAVARSAWSRSSSNMRYEKVFRYNYTISSHLLGVAFSY